MKPVILLAVLAVATTACDRRDDVQDASRTTDTTLAPGTVTSTDPVATQDQAARSTNPDLREAAQGTGTPPTDGTMGDPQADSTRVDADVTREQPTQDTPPPPAPPGG